jgi:hypothetical protein
LQTGTNFWSHLSHFFLEGEMSRTKVVEEIKRDILSSISENRAVCEKIWKKYCKSDQTTDNNIIRQIRVACWIPKVKKHTLRICNTHCLSTARTVARTLLIVILNPQCLSCYKLLYRIFTYFNTKLYIVVVVTACWHFTIYYWQAGH